MNCLATQGADRWAGLWAGLAADFGYHDQAHLAHEFRDFCGATPSEFLQRAAPGGGATIEEPPDQDFNEASFTPAPYQ